MYKIINTLALGLLSFVFLPGQNTFMTSIDLNNDAEYGIQIIRLEDGYLVSSFSRCMNNSVGCIGLLRIDESGQEVYKRMYNAHPDGSAWQPGGSDGIALLNGRYYLSGPIYRGEESSHQVYLMEFDPATGDSLAYIEFGTPAFEVNRGVFPTADGNLLLFNFRNQGANRVWLQKRTPDMELLWERFVGPSYYWHWIRQLAIMDNGDFYFSREVCIPDELVCSNRYFAITRTDSLGNELWSYTYPVKLRDTPISLAKMNGDEIAVSWARNLWYELDSLTPFPPSVLWFDGEGELVRRYDFNADVLRTLINMRRAANGDLIGMGYVRLSSQGLGTCGWIFRISPQGELRWQRTIADLRSRIKSSYFYDVTEDPDGMLVFTGLYQDTFPNHTPAVNNPNVWLVKLDSMGCLEPGCGEVQIVTSTRELVTPIVEKPVLIASPNPAHNFFHLSLAGFAHPVFPLRVRLWDMQGRLVQSTEAQEYPVSIQSRQLPPGVYLAQVQTAAGQMGVVKVVLK